MERIEFIKDNFLGISYYEQEQILEYLMTFLNQSKMKRLSKNFSDIFSEYLNKIKLLREFKESYKEFNSDKRRLTRKILLEELKEAVFNHHIDYSEERIKQYFYYSSEYYGEYKKYFEAKSVSSDDVKNFLIDYSSLSVEEKYNFIEDMIFTYTRINKLSLPYSNKMLDDYRPIIQSIIGDELIKYYNCLYPEEQMQLILKITDEFKWCKQDVDYYNSMLKSIKENPKIVRLLKEETINCCRREFS